MKLLLTIILLSSTVLGSSQNVRQDSDVASLTSAPSLWMRSASFNISNTVSSTFRQFYPQSTPSMRQIRVSPIEMFSELNTSQDAGTTDLPILNVNASPQGNSTPIQLVIQTLCLQNDFWSQRVLAKVRQTWNIYQSNNRYRRDLQQVDCYRLVRKVCKQIPLEPVEWIRPTWCTAAVEAWNLEASTETFGTCCGRIQNRCFSSHLINRYIVFAIATAVGNHLVSHQWINKTQLFDSIKRILFVHLREGPALDELASFIADIKPCTPQVFMVMATNMLKAYLLWPGSDLSAPMTARTVIRNLGRVAEGVLALTVGDSISFKQFWSILTAIQISKDMFRTNNLFASLHRAYHGLIVECQRNAGIYSAPESFRLSILSHALLCHNDHNLALGSDELIDMIKWRLICNCINDVNPNFHEFGYYPFAHMREELYRFHTLLHYTTLGDDFTLEKFKYLWNLLQEHDKSATAHHYPVQTVTQALRSLVLDDSASPVQREADAVRKLQAALQMFIDTHYSNLNMSNGWMTTLGNSIHGFSTRLVLHHFFPDTTLLNKPGYALILGLFPTGHLDYSIVELLQQFSFCKIQWLNYDSIQMRSALTLMSLKSARQYFGFVRQNLIPNAQSKIDLVAILVYLTLFNSLPANLKTRIVQFTDNGNIPSDVALPILQQQLRNQPIYQEHLNALWNRSSPIPLGLFIRIIFYSKIYSQSHLSRPSANAANFSDHQSLGKLSIIDQMHLELIGDNQVMPAITLHNILRTLNYPMARMEQLSGWGHTSEDITSTYFVLFMRRFRRYTSS